MSEPSAAAVRAAAKVAERFLEWPPNLVTEEQAGIASDIYRNAIVGIAAIIDSEFEGLVEVVKELVADGECYCADWVATKGPCGHCKAHAALAAHTTKGAHDKAE